jgi:copper chaperone
MPAFRVTDMTCDGCIRALTSAVREVDATAILQADLTNLHVEVASTAPHELLAEAMREAGFTVQPV